MINQRKISVGILGATGLIGQNLVAMLQDHPWFEISFLTAREQGLYGQVLQGKWLLDKKMPLNIKVYSLEDIQLAKKLCQFVFSALPSELAEQYEEQYASHDLPVISLASFHRQKADVPVIIPEVNSHHFKILAAQQKKRNWKKGFIVTKPNCVLQAAVISLTPLLSYDIESIWITSLQSISGAGAAALSSHQIHDNVIPYIAGEEEKLESEPLKIWGEIDQDRITPNSRMTISAHCNRIPVLNGHLACLSVSFRKKPTIKDIINAWRQFPTLSLPSAPKVLIHYCEEPNRPQIRLDRDIENGMGVTVGRLRPCPISGYRFVALSHNAIRGGAGGAILIAELLQKKGYFG